MSTETILVVDDNKEIVDSLGKLLELEGYQIVTAYDGMEALEKLEPHRPHPFRCHDAETQRTFRADEDKRKL